jgi:hypothetical protein
MPETYRITIEKNGETLTVIDDVPFFTLHVPAHWRSQPSGEMLLVPGRDIEPDLVLPRRV